MISRTLTEKLAHMDLVKLLIDVYSEEAKCPPGSLIHAAVLTSLRTLATQQIDHVRGPLTQLLRRRLNKTKNETLVCCFGSMHGSLWL